jgi:hypothetical protein
MSDTVITQKVAESWGIKLSSTFKIGNQLVYFVEYNGKPVGAVWRWNPSRYGRRTRAMDDPSLWDRSASRPGRGEPRPLTGWRGEKRNAHSTALLKEDGTPFDTRYQAAVAVAGIGTYSTKRVRRASR